MASSKKSSFIRVILELVGSAIAVKRKAREVIEAISAKERDESAQNLPETKIYQAPSNKTRIPLFELNSASLQTEYRPKMSEIEDKKSPTRSLPGFLRRSLRMNYSDDQEETNGDESSESKQEGETVWAAAINGEDQTNGDETTNETTESSTNDEDDSKPASPPTRKPKKKDDPPTWSEEVANAKKPVIHFPSPPPRTIERTISYKEAVFEKAIGADVVSMSDLRKLGWNGIPTQHRAQAWKLLLGYVPANSTRRTQTLERKRSEYRDAIKQHYDINDDTRTLQEQETLRQVLVDVPRTAPEVGLFRDARIRKSLSRLLYIWAMRHPASSYVQGINDLACPLIVVFLSDVCGGKDVMDGSVMEQVTDSMLRQVEADCYWCLTNLLAVIQDHYTSDQPGVQRMVMRLEELVTRIDADLTAHLRDTGIEFMQFAFKWMNCLLLREFNLQCVIRLWDTYISEGDGGFEDFHVYVCAAFLCQFSSQLQAMEFDELFGFMQHIPTDDWSDTEIEILLSQAYVLSTLFGGSDAHLTSQR